MGVASIGQVRALTAPAKEYLWEFIIPQVPEVGGDVPRTLTLRARASSLPGEGNAMATSWFKGLPTKHPTQKQFPGTIPVRFEEGLDAVVLTTLKAWNRAWLDARTGTGKGEDAFKVNALLRVLDHADNVVKTIRLYGFCPENVPDVPLSYESANLLNLEVTFSYDWWDLE